MRYNMLHDQNTEVTGIDAGGMNKDEMPKPLPGNDPDIAAQHNSVCRREIQYRREEPVALFRGPGCQCLIQAGDEEERLLFLLWPCRTRYRRKSKPRRRVLVRHPRGFRLFRMSQGKARNVQQKQRVLLYTRPSLFCRIQKHDILPL